MPFPSASIPHPVPEDPGVDAGAARKDLRTASVLAIQSAEYLPQSQWIQKKIKARPRENSS